MPISKSTAVFYEFTGDVIVLEAGDTVPAGCRILEVYSLKAEGAALTGESVPVIKMTETLMLQKGLEGVPLGGRRNMLYSGSTVVYRRDKAVITSTGMDTEMGKIAGALSLAEKEQTPLQKKMAELSRFLTKEEMPRLSEVPFDSLRKMMSTVHADSSSLVQYTKGAPDEVLKRCTGYFQDGRVVPMTPELSRQILKANKAFTDRGLYAFTRRFDLFETYA